MTDDAAPAPRERGWKRVLLALAAFLLIPLVPLLRALVPVEHTSVLLVPALAACAVVGWYAGGRLALALLWVALAVWITAGVPADSGGYADLARGWGLLVAGSFGLLSLFGTGRTFFPRALAAIGLATAVALALALAGFVPFEAARQALAAEYSTRNAEVMTVLRQWVSQHGDEWSGVLRRFPAAGGLVEDNEAMLGSISRVAMLIFPALLALESLAALALAWALYHRLSRVRLGAPLAPLREFKFNDQLVWGLVVGAAVVLLPTLVALRGAGLNLLVFFGALYALRGLGVLVWLLAPHGGAIVAACILGVLVWPLFTALTVGLGLGDTWRDWRSRGRGETRV